MPSSNGVHFEELQEQQQASPLDPNHEEEHVDWGEVEGAAGYATQPTMHGEPADLAGRGYADDQQQYEYEDQQVDQGQYHNEYIHYAQPRQKLQTSNYTTTHNLSNFRYPVQRR